MRTAILAFSFYLLAVALLPCFMFDNCPEDDAPHASNNLCIPHEQGDADGCGICSPFVNCATCGAVIFVPLTNLLPGPASASSSPLLLVQYVSIIPDEPAGSIWQPPKLA